MPAPWLVSDVDLGKVLEGNALAEVTAKCILVGHQARVYYALENGHRTFLWVYPAIEAALWATAATHTIVDYCAWPLHSLDGPRSPWQKRTRISGTLPGLEQLGDPSRRCRGQRICSFTRKAHVALRGKSPSGEWLTRLAQPYPVAMYHFVVNLAASVTSS